MSCRPCSVLLFLLLLGAAVMSHASINYVDLMPLHSLGLNYYDMQSGNASNRVILQTPSNVSSYFLYSIEWIGQGASLTYNSTDWFVRYSGSPTQIQVVVNTLVRGSRPTVIGVRIKYLVFVTSGTYYLLFINPSTKTVLKYYIITTNINTTITYTCTVPHGVTQVQIRIATNNDADSNNAALRYFTFSLVTDDIIYVKSTGDKYMFVLVDGVLHATMSDYYMSARQASSVALMTSYPRLVSDHDLRQARLITINENGDYLNVSVVNSTIPVREVVLDSPATLTDNSTLAAILVSAAVTGRLFVTHGNDSNRFVSGTAYLRNNTYVGTRTFTFEKPAVVVQLDSSGNEVWARVYGVGEAVVPVTSVTRYIAVYDYATNVMMLFISVTRTQTVTPPAVGQVLEVNASPFRPAVDVPGAFLTAAREHPAMFALIPALIISVGGRKYASAFIALAGIMTYVLAVSVSPQYQTVISNAALILGLALVVSVVYEARRW